MLIGLRRPPKLETLRMEKIALNVNSEYERLKSVLVSTGNTLVDSKYEKKFQEKYGSSMDEEIQYHSEAGNVRAVTARKQHRTFLDVLKRKGVDLINAKDVKEAIYQVFTRDVGFVIGDTFYYAILGDGVRKREQGGLEYLNNRFIKYRVLQKGTIEGGDVFIHGKKVFVGITKYSTNEEGFTGLKDELEPKGYECVPIRCKDNILHLDCRFHIISKDHVLLFRKDINASDVKILEKNFNIIDIKEEELVTLGSNIFCISPTEVVIDKRNQRLGNILKEEGFDVIQLDYSELTKMWGAFRCTTLPLFRSGI